MKQRIAYSFRHGAEAKQAELTRVVLERMTNNPIFDSLKDQLDSLQAKYTEWQKAAAEAKGRDREKVLLKNEKRNACIDQLYRIATQVNTMALDNVEIALASGLPLRKTRQKISEIKAPVIEKVKRLDKEGSIELMWNKVKGAATYAIEYSTDDGQQWQNGTYCLSHRRRMEGFQPGVKTMFKIKAIGAEVMSDWSAPVGIWMS